MLLIICKEGSNFKALVFSTKSRCREIWIESFVALF